MMDVSAASVGYVGFLFGVFAACWAQTTKRNPWIWFFFGWLLAPVAGLVLLWKNGGDHAGPPRMIEAGRIDLIATRKDIP
jgi:hypothetical protein